MALAQARAIVPDIVVADIDRHQDGDALATLVGACERFTPLVAGDGPDGVILDISGCAHLFGGEPALRRCVQDWLATLGWTTRAAVAGTPDAARAFARFSPGGIITPDDAEALACTLPVAALEADAETTTALTRAGLRTLGDLAERLSHALAARFGEAFPVRLHRILGREDRRITPMRTPPDIMAERHFPEPLLTADRLLAVMELLAREVAGRLERRGDGGRAFTASFFRSDGVVRRITVETAQSMRDPAALMRLLRLKIETLADPLDPGFGFDAVRLAVLRSEPLAVRQETLIDGSFDGSRVTAEDEALAALVDRLVARFGRAQVGRFIAHDSHDPLAAAACVPYLSTAASAPWPCPEPGEPPCRPLTVFAPPQPIEALAEVPDGPPLRFRWRRVIYTVARAEGPERIAPAWWEEDAHRLATRDYYRVEDTEGHRFWLFRAGLYETAAAQPSWFLHGLFA